MKTKTNPKLVTFSRGKSGMGDMLMVAVRPGDVVEVYPDVRYMNTSDAPWTKIILRNKSEHTVNHSFEYVVAALNAE